MKKISVFILFLFLNFSLFSDKIFTQFDYKLIDPIPLIFFPEERIQNGSINVKVKSEYGKIYYLVNSNFSDSEPIEYVDGIYLKGEKNRIIDYDITIILEKDDGRVELFSTTYRIDRTEERKRKKDEDKNFYTKKILRDDFITEVDYNFIDNNYGFYLNKNKFEFPVKVVYQKERTKNITIKEKDNTISSYLVGISYGNDFLFNTDIDSYFINLTTPEKPDFGSLYWGQVYKQKTKIKINPFEKDHTIYYYYKEWHKDQLLFGPSIDSTSDWFKYTEPIELTSKFGENGIISLAAYSIAKNGKKSKLSGPYFFKVMDVENTFTQTFPEENKKYKREATINEKSFYEIKNIYEKAVIRFNDYSNDDRFYFTFNSRFYSGKSDFLVCKDKYEFVNNENEPVEIEFFYSNGENFGSIVLYNKEYNLPVVKNYKSNYIDLSDDTIIEFYMPENFIVRYEITKDLNKRLEVNNNSQIFPGQIKITEESENESIYKIKFASFDKNNNFIAESDYYYIKIDKQSPVKDVEAKGIDFNTFHNDTQVLKLIPPENDAKIYYRINDKKEWSLYDEPLKFIPPLFGRYYIELYVKSVDKVGNERINPNPFVIKFDTRAIFVDINANFNGNGTEDSPINSLERGILLAKKKNLKVIYLKNNKINISLQSFVDSDVIIQPYNIENNITMNLISKAISKKEHKWFTISKSGYLELRNINFNIKGGNKFISLDSSKTKIYNGEINIVNKNNFDFIESKNGKIGLKYISINTETTSDINLIKIENGTVIADSINATLNAENINFFVVNNCKNIILDKINIILNNNGNSNFIIGTNSNIKQNNIIYKQSGNFKISNIFYLNNCKMNLTESDFIIDGEAPFEIKVSESKKSDLYISDSLFRIKRGFSIIGFNIYDGNITFHKSMLDTQNATQYSYNFRIERSKIKFLTSIIRNYNCEQAVSFVLNKATFSGVNNSIFNAFTKGRSFNFWITESSTVASVNSFYYFSEETNKNCFIFGNNENKDFLNLYLYSNAITTNTTLFETLKDFNKKYYEEEFEKENIFYDFKDNFKLEDDYFFIPQIDSPLLQGGVDQIDSTIEIPEFDFFGKNRLIGGIGIDIGAVQISGYIR